MQLESFGPVVNADGSPTEFTKQMFQVQSPRDERDRYLRRIEEMRSAIAHDFSQENWRKDSHFHGHVLEATRQCIDEMQELEKQVRRLDDQIVDEIRKDFKHSHPHSEEFDSTCTACLLGNDRFDDDSHS